MNDERPSIYLDYNATTPLDPEVREAMLPFLGTIFGNPSSVHHVGRRARSLLDDARYRMAALWDCKPSEVVFTSGGTESNNLAIFGTARRLKDNGKGRHLITTAIEHHAALHCFQYLEKREGFEVTYLPVDEYGVLDPDDLKSAIRDDTLLASVMAANNEIGSIQPVAKLGAICREHGVLFHTDAAQWFGKRPFDTIHQFNADLVSCCSHKFYGPKGAGALFVRSPLLPDPILFGGGHENERRAGTENLAAIMGFTEAAERFLKRPVFDEQRIGPLASGLRDGIRSRLEITCYGREPDLLCNTVSFSVEGCDGMALMAGLDREGICASSGSACSAGSLEPSHVLTAIGESGDRANALVRFSLGRETTEAETNRVLEKLPGIIHRIRSI